MGTLPDHLFVSEIDGHLYDTRDDEWWHKAPLRSEYRKSFARIKNAAQLKATLRAGGYAWPGGYQIVLITNDGDMVKPQALAKDKRAFLSAVRDIKGKCRSRIIGSEIYYEGPPAECAYTGERIESAYGDPEESGE